MPRLRALKKRSPRIAVDAADDFSSFTTLALESAPLAPDENRSFRLKLDAALDETLEGPALGPARKLEDGLRRAGARGAARGREARGDAAAPGAARS